jgi:hypothetical protein
MDAAQRERAARSQQHAREFARRYAELATRVNATLAGATHALGPWPRTLRQPAFCLPARRSVRHQPR